MIIYNHGRNNYYVLNYQLLPVLGVNNPMNNMPKNEVYHFGGQNMRRCRARQSFVRSPLGEHCEVRYDY